MKQKSKRNTKRFILVIFAVLLVWVIFVAVEFGFLNLGSSTQLKTLENLISSIQPTTGRELTRNVQDTERGFTGPIYAEIFVQFEPINDYTKKDVYDEIVAILEKNSWEENECRACDVGFFSAYLSQDPYPIPLSVTVHIKSNKNIVSIRITHPKP